MRWYERYLSVYDKPFDEAPADVVAGVRAKMAGWRSEAPEVSVVAIAYNEERRLLACLWSLCDNIVDLPCEIIVVNNNSTDATQRVLDTLGVRYFNEEKRGPGNARQCGVDHARGKWHLCVDSDTLYPPYYIYIMVGALRRKGAVCAYALWSFLPREGYSRLGLAIYEGMRDIYMRVQDIKRPELNVRGMAFAFVTEEGRRYGFRTDIRRGEDGSLALALKGRGRLIFVTSRKARVMTGYGTLSADGSLWGAFKTRMKKAATHFFSLFHKQEKYEDSDDNLLS